MKKIISIENLRILKDEHGFFATIVGENKEILLWPAEVVHIESYKKGSKIVMRWGDVYITPLTKAEMEEFINKATVRLLPNLDFKVEDK